MSLVDLGAATDRIYGGVGFSVATFPTTLSCEHSDTLKLLGFDQLDQKCQSDIEDLLDRVRGICGNLKVALILVEATPQHIGLGSKTALLLSIATLLNEFIPLSLTRRELQLLSERGGASGVGVHSFFDGGLIVDAGHERRDNGTFLPSSAKRPLDVPVAVSRQLTPESWSIALLLPCSGQTYDGDAEIEFFKENTPIESAEIYSVLAAVYHGVVPAFSTSNLGQLKQSLRQIREHGFKRREIEAQPAELSKLIGLIDSHLNVAVGMSSMGPLIYAIFNKHQKHIPAELKKLTEGFDLDFIKIVEFNNKGREIQ